MGYVLSNMKSIVRNGIGIGVIIAAVAIGLHRLDHSIVVETLKDINVTYMLAAILATLMVMGLSTLRFAYLDRKFGGNENFLHLHRINMLSLLYSQIALPLISQIIGRVSHGRKERSVFYAPITVLEKSIAFAIMILLGGLASYFLLNQNIVPEGFSTALLVLLGAVIITLTLIQFVFYDTDERRELFQVLRKITQLGVGTVLGISICIQMGILFIYTILALQFVGDAPLITLVGGFAIVVLATSIPIGFGGWGVREAAAAGIFIALGLPPEIGVVIGVLYGLIHLILLILTVLVLNKTPSQANAEGAAPTQNPFAGITIWPLTFLLMLGLFPFQIRLPLAEGLITINSVDIIALVVMINFILLKWMKAELRSLWDDKLMWAGILCLGLMISIGWVVGWFKFGSNEWATANRFTGLILVMSYLFSGAALRQFIQPEQAAKLVGVLIFSIFISIIIKTIAYDFINYGHNLYFNWSTYTSGFIADRNALGFLIGLSGVLFAYHLPYFKNTPQKTLTVFVLSTIMFLMTFSGSRTSLAVVFFLLIWMLWVMPKQTPWMMGGGLLALIFVKAINIYNESIPYKIIIFHDGRKIENMFTFSDMRSSTFQYGLELFQSNPFLGAGLGAGIEGIELVIHNLYLWILGEMGLLGAMLCIPIGIAFFRTSSRLITQTLVPLRQNHKLHALALFIIICGGFSLVQDIAYQRILWLVVGFLMAAPALVKDSRPHN